MANLRKRKSSQYLPSSPLSPVSQKRQTLLNESPDNIDDYLTCADFEQQQNAGYPIFDTIKDASNAIRDDECDDDDEIDVDNDEDEDNQKQQQQQQQTPCRRRKIPIEYIEEKSRRQITFNKRRAGIMKKAYELSALTGSQVFLLVVSETGLVHSFCTPNFLPIVNEPEGIALLQSCLDEDHDDAVDGVSDLISPENETDDVNNNNSNNARRLPQNFNNNEDNSSRDNIAMITEMNSNQQNRNSDSMGYSDGPAKQTVRPMEHEKVDQSQAQTQTQTKTDSQPQTLYHNQLRSLSESYAHNQRNTPQFGIQITNIPGVDYSKQLTPTTYSFDDLIPSGISNALFGPTSPLTPNFNTNFANLDSNANFCDYTPYSLNYNFPQSQQPLYNPDTQQFHPLLNSYFVGKNR